MGSGPSCRAGRRGRGYTAPVRRDALTEACRTGDVVVALVPMRWDCGRGVVAIDRRDLARGGTHAVYLGGGRRRIETVAEERGRRPWTSADPTPAEEEAPAAQ